MGRKAESVVPVDGQDVINSLLAIRKDTGCEARITLKLGSGDFPDLIIVVETYTDHGAPIGVAREISVHRPRPSKGLLGQLMCDIHRAYHTTCKRTQTALDGGK